MATAVFADKVGLIHGETTTFLHHLGALGLVSAFTFAGSFVLYKVVDQVVPLRVTRDQEELGLDISQHGESVLGSEAALEMPAVLETPAPVRRAEASGWAGPSLAPAID